MLCLERGGLRGLRGVMFGLICRNLANRRAITGKVFGGCVHILSVGLGSDRCEFIFTFMEGYVHVKFD